MFSLRSPAAGLGSDDGLVDGLLVDQQLLLTATNCRQTAASDIWQSGEVMPTPSWGLTQDWHDTDLRCIGVIRSNGIPANTVQNLTPKSATLIYAFSQIPCDWAALVQFSRRR
jgi:hypothetical protein